MSRNKVYVHAFSCDMNVVSLCKSADTCNITANIFKTLASTVVRGYTAGPSGGLPLDKSIYVVGVSYMTTRTCI